MLDFFAELWYNTHTMKFTLDPTLMVDIHKQFAESELKTEIIHAILKAQRKTRQAVYEIFHNIPSRLGDKVLKYYLT